VEYLVNLATTIAHERLDDTRAHAAQRRRTSRSPRRTGCAPIGAALPFGCVGAAA